MRPLLPLLVVTSLLGLESPAQAQPLERSMAVLELYVGETPFEKTPDYAKAVQEQLADAENFAAISREDAAKQLLGLLSSGARPLSDTDLASLNEEYKKGEKLVFDDPKKSIAPLDALLKRLDQSAASLSLNPAHRELWFNTALYLGFAHQTQKNQAAATALYDLVVRRFGDTVKLDPNRWHPFVVQLYDQRLHEYKAQAKGSIRAKLAPAGAKVYVDGSERSPGSDGMITEVPPGKATVQATYETQQSMLHHVEVRPNETAQVAIDIDFEGSLAFGEGRFGLRFPSLELSEAQIADFASRIGRLLNVDEVLAVGLVQRGERTQLAGYVVNVRNATLALEPDFREARANVINRTPVRQLAAYVTTRQKPVGVIKPWYTRWWGWVAGGVALGAGGGGIGLYLEYESVLKDVLCNDPAPKCLSTAERVRLAPTAVQYRNGAYVMWGGAGVLLAASALLFVLVTEEEEMSEEEVSLIPTLAPLALPGGGGLTLSFTF
jgi:hypothetical protein